MPRLLTSSQTRGLVKAGNIYCPGSQLLPSFEESDCAQNIDQILPHIRPSDQHDLKLLLNVLAYAPRFTIWFLIWFCEVSYSWSLPNWNLIRQLRLGLRGLIFALYYGSVKPHFDSHPARLIGFTFDNEKKGE